MAGLFSGNGKIPDKSFALILKGTLLEFGICRVYGQAPVLSVMRSR